MIDCPLASVQPLRHFCVVQVASKGILQVGMRWRGSKRIINNGATWVNRGSVHSRQVYLSKITVQPVHGVPRVSVLPEVGQPWRTRVAVADLYACAYMCTVVR